MESIGFVPEGFVELAIDVGGSSIGRQVASFFAGG